MCIFRTFSSSPPAVPILMQFGKVSTDEFILDFQYPFNGVTPPPKIRSHERLVFTFADCFFRGG